MSRRDRWDEDDFKEYYKRYKRDKKDKKDNFPILPGMTEAQIEMQIRKRVQRRIEKRNEFIGHLISYVVVNGFLWALYLSSNNWRLGEGIPWPAWVTFFWGIGMFAHAMEVYQTSGRAEARREALIQREVEMEKQRRGLYEKPKREMYEKPKRDQQMGVGDDGELVPLEELLAQEDDEEEEDEAPRFNHQRRRD